jgi:carbon storage regulator
MLVLTRQVGGSMVIGDGIVVTVVANDGHNVRIGIEAPRHVPVHREEIARAGRAAAGLAGRVVPQPHAVVALQVLQFQPQIARVEDVHGDHASRQLFPHLRKERRVTAATFFKVVVELAQQQALPCLALNGPRLSNSLASLLPPAELLRQQSELEQKRAAPPAPPAAVRPLMTSSHGLGAPRLPS